jgi:nucleoside-diphosphate-sugar epimerase
VGWKIRDGRAGVEGYGLKIAVTGAAGFVGRYVVAELKKRSISPILVRRRKSVVPNSDEAGAAIVLDIRNPGSNAFELLGKPDSLIHLAWGNLPHYSLLQHFEEEMPAHYLFLKGLVEAGLKNLVVTGTCLEYGMQSGRLYEDQETHPIVPYGVAKDGLRRQLQLLQRTMSFNLTWARLFYLFGEGQAQTSLLPQLQSAVERGEKVFKMSGGEQLRDYMPVTRAAEHLVTLANAARDHGIVNVCSGRPLSVRSLVEGWIKQYGWSITLGLAEHPYPQYEPMAFWGSSAKLESYLGCVD